MARDMYVGNNPQPRAVLDFEIGLHIGSCPTEACQLLLRAVGSLLVPSHPDDHIQLGAAIDALEAAMPSEEDK